MWTLIDGNNWYARDFFASGPSAPGNFIRRLDDLIAQLSPERVAIAWDTRSFRHDISPSYKAHRSPKPDGFASALTELQNTLALRDIYSYSSDGFEADDLLAAMAASAIDEGIKAMIFSSDRDLHQCLVSGRVNQVTAVGRRDRHTLDFTITTADLLHKANYVHPHQWIDYRSMLGDKSDNITGCPGVGPAAAAEVLRACGSLDGFYANPLAPRITARQRESLLAFRERLPDVQALLTLRIDAPLPTGWLEGVVV